MFSQCILLFFIDRNLWKGNQSRYKQPGIIDILLLKYISQFYFCYMFSLTYQRIHFCRLYPSMHISPFLWKCRARTLISWPLFIRSAFIPVKCRPEKGRWVCFWHNYTQQKHSHFAEFFQTKQNYSPNAHKFLMQRE